MRRAFAKECRKLLAAAQHAHQDAAQTEAGLVGTQRVGVVTSALSEPLLSTIAEFRQVRPRVELQVTEVNTPAGQDLVARHDLDIAVIRPSAPVRGLRMRPWRHDQFVIALPEWHSLAAEGTTAAAVDLSRFADEP
jgi:DNA-binding transcriptional LysR family regulator